MASTTFVDGETLIEASWLNDVNAAVYTPGTIDAANVSNTPNTGSGGTIAATTVQAALNELDAEKQPLDATLTAISGDTLLPTIADGTLGAFSHRNKIINGGFAVNQRAYVSGAAVGAGLYGHDRWKMAASGDTYTFSTTANKTTVTIPATKVLQQVVEGLNLQSGTYILTWEGTAQGKIGAGSLSASGVTGSITGGTDTTIEFGPGTVANVQLEFGSVATPFGDRPYGVELALCQRYLRRWTGYLLWNTSAAATQVHAQNYVMGMRTTPTASIITAGTLSNCTESVAIIGTGGIASVIHRITATDAGTMSASGTVIQASAEL